jgi:MFS family permease
MLVSPVERPVASAAYGFVRFIGGGLAPFAAGKLAEHFNLHVPFVVGAVAVAVGIGVLATAHRMLADADAGMTGHAPAGDDEIAGEIADEFGGAPGAIDDELHSGQGRHAATSRS